MRTQPDAKPAVCRWGADLGWWRMVRAGDILGVAADMCGDAGAWQLFCTRASNSSTPHAIPSHVPTTAP